MRHFAKEKFLIGELRKKFGVLVFGCFKNDIKNRFLNRSSFVKILEI